MANYDYRYCCSRLLRRTPAPFMGSSIEVFDFQTWGNPGGVVAAGLLRIGLGSSPDAGRRGRAEMGGVFARGPSVHVGSVITSGIHN